MGVDSPADCDSPRHHVIHIWYIILLRCINLNLEGPLVGARWSHAVYAPLGFRFSVKPANNGANDSMFGDGFEMDICGRTLVLT